MLGRVVTSLSLVALLAACGAPVKSADEVTPIFEQDVASLQEKASTLCTDLTKRTEAPSLTLLAIDVENCGGVGKEAQNYKNSTEFAFARFEEGVSQADKANDIIHMQTRSQVWLNKSILGFVSRATQMMNAKKGSGAGAIKLPDSATGLMKNLVTPKMEMLEPPKINTETLEFGLKIRYTLTGIVTFDHTLTINGKVIDNKIAVTVTSGEDKKIEESIVQGFKVLLLIIPHAEDVYIDTFLDIRVNNPGMKAVLEGQLKQALSSAMKSIIDMMMTV